MRFRRNWRVIKTDIWGGVIFTTVVTVPVYYEIIKARHLNALILMLLMQMLFYTACFLGYYTKGVFTDVIFLNRDSIILFQHKKSQQEIKWENICRIVRSSKPSGGFSLVIWDAYGTKIWFNNNLKIESFILSVLEKYPDIKNSFPMKDDYRVWDMWDQKLKVTYYPGKFKQR